MGNICCCFRGQDRGPEHPHRGAPDFVKFKKAHFFCNPLAILLGLEFLVSLISKFLASLFPLANGKSGSLGDVKRS